MKKCKSCHQEKSLEEFNKNQINCRSCAKEIQRIWRLENKARIAAERKVKREAKQSLRAKECRRCGFRPEHICQLTIDHIDGHKTNESPDNLQTLCHNCHHLKTYVERKDRSLLRMSNLIPAVP